jgi:23S rRNA (cytosine1962-C5)-methyltransferase
MKRIILKKGEEARIWRGHPWVYDNEIKCVLEGKGNGKAASKGQDEEGEEPLVAASQLVAASRLVAGEIADVETYNKHYLGRAFVNPASKIIARIYSGSKEGVDTGFFKRRIKEAILKRAQNSDLRFESRRLVFAEADFLPGLIIDYFAGWELDEIEKNNFTLPLALPDLLDTLGQPKKYLSFQILTYALEERRNEIMTAIKDLIPQIFDGGGFSIIEKFSSVIREKEGIAPREPIVECGALPIKKIVIFENGFPFIVDLSGGQKTGHYLDQRQNHSLAFRYAAAATPVVAASVGAAAKAPRRILDAFCYSGGFAINAARGIANDSTNEIIAVDSSEAALELTKENARLNGVNSIKTIRADVFDLLTQYERRHEKFDMIILDPPAFSSSHTTIENAKRGYKEINLKALKMLNRGGVLITCSCSEAMSEAMFKKMICEAAKDAHVRLVQNEFRYQADDHPVLVGYEESFYLKCGVYTVAS